MTGFTINVVLSEGAQETIGGLIEALDSLSDSLTLAAAAQVALEKVREERRDEMARIFGIEPDEPEPEPAHNAHSVRADRQRQSPLKRRPSNVVREEVIRWLEDGEWRTPRAYATFKGASGRRENEYYRHQADKHMRDLNREGLIERRASEEPGSIWQYRFAGGGGTLH